jgi:formate hydrogenlyase transcriptional activator
MNERQPERLGGNLLIVDDDLYSRQILETMLTQEGYDVRCAPNGETALMFAGEDPPELILLDVRMPDMSGYEVCRRLKEDQRTCSVPVIYISALTDEADKVRGFAEGAVDYVTKPLYAEELLARVKTHLTLSRMQKQIEAQNAQLEQEIIKSKRAEEKIKQVAEEWRATFDSIRDPVSIHDREYRIVRANRAFAEAFGMEIRAVLGKRCFEIVHGTEAAWPACPHRQTLESGKPVTEEVFEPRLGKYLQVSVSGIWNGQHEMTGSVHIIKDITERKGAEEALRKAHDELEERVRERTAALVLASEQLEMSANVLKERLEFESLLAEISGRFINLPVDRVDAEINDAQRRICETLHLDRSTIWLSPKEDPETMRLVHIHPVPEGPSLPERMDAREFFPWSIQKLLSGGIVTISKMTDLPREAAARDAEMYRLYNTRSTVIVPLRGREKPFGALSFAMTRQEQQWSESVVKGFQLISQVFANALERKRMEEELKQHLEEIERLKERLEQENIYLQKEIKLLVQHAEIMGQSLVMKKVLSQAEKVGPTESAVLLLGETGTGKELLARAIHGMSTRKGRPLVTINCASLPPTLIESELFGRERGAYTGALTKLIGRFEIADGSTLFLDEIGEFPFELQSKLLRVLETGDFERLGSTRSIHTDVRIIAATNRDLSREVAQGRFRRDLFYRLNVFPIVVPPLRDRPEDIPLLVWGFVKEFQKRMGKEVESVSRKSMEAMQSYSWPGNVRELRNVVERAMIVTSSRSLVIPLPEVVSSETPTTGNLQETERKLILSVLQRTGWRVGGKNGAAEVLGLKRSTLYSKMKKIGIKLDRPTF